MKFLRVMLAAALCAAGTLSHRVAGEEAFAVYTMAKSVSVFGVMERLEPLVSAALLMGFFALESLLFASARAQLERVLQNFPPVNIELTEEERFAAALALTSALPERAFVGEYERLFGTVSDEAAEPEKAG